LHRFTDAFAPIPDALVLVFSLLGQLLLVGRRVESWWCWIVVNAIAVPLYARRGLTLTALLYVGFLINAGISLRHWTRMMTAGRDPAPSAD
jgi:nicotinamide mononucleotide transporter